jgi:hypothetical protein
VLRYQEILSTEILNSLSKQELIVCVCVCVCVIKLRRDVNNSVLPLHKFPDLGGHHMEVLYSNKRIFQVYRTICESLIKLF